MTDDRTPIEPEPERPDLFAPPPRDPRAPSPTVLIALALTLVVSLLGNALIGARMRDQRAEIADLRARISQLQRDLDTLQGQPSGGTSPILRVASAVERIRGLRFRSEVAPEILAPDAFRQRVRTEIVKESAEEELASSERVLEMLGVIPTDYDLYDEIVAIQLEQVAGFYDEKGKKLVVPAEDASRPSPLDRQVLAHEFTHALTDQHFGLAAIDRLQKGDKDDQALAFIALAEGDAEAVRRRFEQSALTTSERQAAQREAAGIGTDRFLEAPRFLQEGLLFPYLQGVTFVQTLIDRGGGTFRLVDRAYRDPPRSTEQILHPARYLSARDDPIVVSMPDVGSALGEGWRRIEAGEVGELDLKLVAAYGGQGLSARDARVAAQGWDGGSYAGFTSGNRTVVAMSLAFDSDTELREADRLIARWLPLRFRNVGSAYRVDDGSGWDGRDGAGVVVRSASRLVLILGSEREDVDRARAAFGTTA